MPIVVNATKEKQSFKAHGKWFTFIPGQKKLMSDDLAQFIGMERKSNGMAVLPAEFEDPDFEKTEEGKALMAKSLEEAVDSYLAFHRDIIKNNQVSLRKDLARKNEKVDPAVEISDGELRSMEIVAAYQKTKADSKQKQVDHVKELMKNVGPLS